MCAERVGSSSADCETGDGKTGENSAEDDRRYSCCLRQCESSPRAAPLMHMQIQ